MAALSDVVIDFFVPVMQWIEVEDEEEKTKFNSEEAYILYLFIITFSRGPLLTLRTRTLVFAKQKCRKFRNPTRVNEKE